MDDGDEGVVNGGRFRCPGCDEEVDVPVEVLGQLVRCPSCNADFFAVEGQAHLAVVDDIPPAPADLGPPDELNAVRVRQLATLRMATLRARSWCLIGLLLSAITAIDLLCKAAAYLSHPHAWDAWPTLLVVGGLAATALAVAAARAARRLGQEAATPALQPPTEPPDFSTLGDGTDRWRRLEEIR
jgi:hypothetical protein